MSDFDILEHLKTTHNSGVRIGNCVVCFSPKENLREEVNYSITDSSENMWHLVADLKEGVYGIYENNKAVGTVHVQTQDNTALFRTQTISDSLSIKLIKKVSNITPILIYLLN